MLEIDDLQAESVCWNKHY